MPDVPPSYRGRLYFVLGPGLGDTVNGLRILHEVLRIYPLAEPVVWVDPRWQDLYPLIPELAGRRVRFYAAAPSADSAGKGDRERPFHRTFDEVVGEVVSECQGSGDRVAVGGFKLPDQLARTENTIAMLGRAIGLPLEPKQCRPYLPLSEEWRTRGLEFLRQRGLTPGRYLVIAPHTWPDKSWPHPSWEELLAILNRETGLPVLVAGLPDYPPLRGPQVQAVLGLPLPLVAAAVSEARCYIGLDSGLTHLAAAFDVPIVTLNAQGKFPPFLIQANSPYRWTILTPGIYGDRPIPVRSVAAVVRRVLDYIAPPSCPLCAGTPYVLAAGSDAMLHLCRCGLITRVGGETAHESTAAVTPSTSPSQFPTTVRDLAGFQAQLAAWAIVSGADEWVLTFDHWDPVGADAGSWLTKFPSRDLWWTWDAACRVVRLAGLRVKASSLRPAALGSGALWAVRLTIQPASSGLDDPTLTVPWGETRLRMRASVYEQWLSWECFRKSDELEGIGWALAQEGDPRQGLALLRLALRTRPRVKTLIRVLRVAAGAVQEMP